jgi:Glycoside-hydrolase family GH114
MDERMRLLVALCLLYVGCSSGPGSTGPELDGGHTPDASVDLDEDAGTALQLRLPPVNAAFDYQLGGPYAPPSGVEIVTRDRTAAPAEGLFNICYVNGFQIQPDEVDFWRSQHPELMLRDASGELVVDPDWDEILLDVRTPEKRAAIAEVIGGWIQGCAASGFDAVEIDNLDSYSRSGGLVSEGDAVALFQLFSAAAHASGLSIAQKNSAELIGHRSEMGADFAVVEECNRYDECGVFTGAYGQHVLVIEYQTADFTKGCSEYPELSIVLRDLDLVTPERTGYVFDGC